MNVRHLLLLMALAATPARALAEPTIEWIRQFGTEFRPAGVAVDERGDVYVSGGDGPWSYPAGFGAAFLNKYDAAGDLLWTRQRFCISSSPALKSSIGARADT